MTAEHYVIVKMRAPAAAFTADEARALFDQARADPRHGLEGDLDEGFSFWTFTGDGNKLVRISIEPER